MAGKLRQSIFKFGDSGIQYARVGGGWRVSGNYG
jgi:hypothetical protein